MTLCPACGQHSEMLIDCPSCGGTLPHHEYREIKEFIPMIRYQKPEPVKLPEFLEGLEWLLESYAFPGMSLQIES